MQLQVETQIYKKDAIKDGIDVAATQATNYITYVNENVGIQVHNKTRINKDFIQINATDISMWRNGKRKVELGDTYLTFYDGNGTADTNKLAQFGGDIKIYKPGTGLAVIDINSQGAYIDGSVQIGGRAQSEYLNSNIQIGGRNLARGTANIIKGTGAWDTATWRDSGSSNTYNYTVSDSPVPSVNKGVLITTATANTRYGIAQDYCPMLSKTITYSVWAKGTAGGTITLQSVWWSNIPSSANWSKQFTANGSWQYLSFTTDLTNVTVPNGACSICYMYWTGVNANDTCVFVAPKLEYGNKATDWSPAPEDMATIDELDLVNLKHSVQTIDANTKIFKNVTSLYSSENPYTGYIVITTPITPNRMNNIHIIGYNYTSVANGGRIIDVSIGFYNYSSSIAHAEFSNKGDFNIESVQIAKVSSSDNRAVIILGTATKKWYFPRLVVDEALISYTSPPNSYVDGWTITTPGTTLPTGYVQTVSCTEYNASKTATSYITHIDNSGIFISPYNQSPSINAAGNSIKIDGTGMYIYKGGTEQAHFTGTEAAIGTAGQNQVIINSNGLHVYKYIDNQQEDVALFGETARIGIEDSSHFIVGSQQLQAFDSIGARYFEVNDDGIFFKSSTTTTDESLRNIDEFINELANDIEALDNFTGRQNSSLSNSLIYKINTNANQITSINNKLSDYTSIKSLVTTHLGSGKALYWNGGTTLVLKSSNCSIETNTNTMTFKYGSSTAASINSDAKVSINNAIINTSQQIGTQFKWVVGTNKLSLMRI